MGKLSLVFWLLLSVICIALLGDYKQQKNQFNTDLLIKAQAAAVAMDKPQYRSGAQNGEVTFVSDGNKVSQRQVRQLVNSQRRSHKKPLSFSLNDTQGQFATLLTPGIDHQHHFANSYLVGIRPFAVENNWLPLYLLAQRKSYQLDSEQYGLLEVWQNSAQAYINLRGDCEDHALALADWLISEGIDAKVALGTYKGTGHAWVVAYHNNQVFLLEATEKRANKSWNHYPIASSATGYHAQILFDRKHMWYFDRNTLENKHYSLRDWKRVSQFENVAPSL